MNKIKGGDCFAEKLQHEYDHLSGILTAMRAIDDKSLCLKSLKNVSLGE